MKIEAVTIMDIARELGISKSTVSRALNDSTDISLETKKKVIEVAQRLDYMPNPMALNLLRRRSNSIGVVVPDISNPFFSLVFAGMDTVAYNKGYHVMMFQSYDIIEREKTIVKHIFNSRADGLLVSLSSQTEHIDHFRLLHEKGFPIVFFDRISTEISVPCVSVDDFDGAYQATKHLIEQGCSRIAHIGGDRHLAISQKRLNGFRAALLDYQLPIVDEFILAGPYQIESGIALTDNLLEIKNRPDGIFCASDRIACGAHYAIRKAGLQMPHDIALIGFSDLPLDILLDPSLSSMAQPVHDIGRVAVELLIDLIENKNPDRLPVHQVFKTTLKARQSSLIKP